MACSEDSSSMSQSCSEVAANAGGSAMTLNPVNSPASVSMNYCMKSWHLFNLFLNEVKIPLKCLIESLHTFFILIAHHSKAI
jgi:hypothetical protein